jgi:hypothetical protein
VEIFSIADPETSFAHWDKPDPASQPSPGLPYLISLPITQMLENFHEMFGFDGPRPSSESNIGTALVLSPAPVGRRLGLRPASKRLDIPTASIIFNFI